MINSSLSKKTKAEILDEYEQLLKKQEELKLVSEQIYKPVNQELLTKTKAYDSNTISQSISSLKTSVNASLNQLASAMLNEVQKLQEMQQAIELQKQNLQTHYQVQVGADTLISLINECESKKKTFEEEMTSKKRDWTRDQEEYQYQVKLNNRREQELFNEEATKKELDLKQREQNIKKEELEITGLKKQVQEIPQLLEKELREKEKQVLMEAHGRAASDLLLSKKEWAAEKNLQELEIKNLKEQIDRQGTEIILLRKEAELASKKAQELAVKVIESSSSHKKETELSRQ